MERKSGSRGGRPPWTWLCSLIVVLPALAASLPCPSFASEALGDLDLRVRLIDVTSQGAGRSGDMTGAARIEVIAQSAVHVSEVQLRVLRPDGTAWTVRSRPFHPGEPMWSRVGGGEPLEPDGGSTSFAARESARAILRVPLEGTGVHEIIVELTGNGPDGTLRTENAVRAPLGVALPLPEDDGSVALYRVGVTP